MAAPERKFFFEHRKAPGDVLMLSGLVRDLKLHYGERYQVNVSTNFPALWRCNPYLSSIQPHEPGVERIVFSNREAAASSLAKRGHKLHYITAPHRYFKERTGITVPCLHSRGDLHLSAEELANPYISGRYWIIIPGGKEDMTNKIYSIARMQEVVDKLRQWGLRFVQEGATKKLCIHPPLYNVTSVVGTTSVRDIIVNIAHAEGVICGVTFPMHIAGALEKPCVVLGGGREEPYWEAYTDHWKAFGPHAAPVRVPHRYLHTLGLLDCCRKRGCWLRRVVPLGDNTKYDRSLCKYPMKDFSGQMVPKCMDMIPTEAVLNAVMWYYEQGYLPPPQWKRP